jgi:hypothetical protein
MPFNWALHLNPGFSHQPIIWHPPQKDIESSFLKNLRYSFSKPLKAHYGSPGDKSLFHRNNGEGMPMRGFSSGSGHA